MSVPIDDKVTDRQKAVIGYIYKNTGYEFKGKTKKEAREFISKHINTSKMVTRIPKSGARMPRTRDAWTNAFYDYRPY